MRAILFTAAALLGLAGGVQTFANVPVRTSGEAADVAASYGTAGRAASVRTGHIASWSKTRFVLTGRSATDRTGLKMFDQVAQAEQTGADGARRG